MASEMNWLLRFLYDKDFNSLKGVLGTALQLAGVIGALLAARVLLTRPPLVARNLDPVACLDLARFHESLTRRGFTFPAKLREKLLRLVPQAPPTIPDENPQWAYSKMPHYIVCWYQPDRTPERVAEVEKERRARKGARPMRLGLSGGPEARVAAAKERFLTAQREGPVRIEPGNAATDVFLLSDLATSERPLDLFDLLRPADPTSAFANRDAWKVGQLMADSTANAVASLIESECLPPLETSVMFEEANSARWAVNRIEVMNTSAHLVSGPSRLTVDHAGIGQIEVLGGTIDFEKRGQVLTTSIGPLLPGDSRWAVIRTASVTIAPSQITLATDKVAIPDPRSIWIATAAALGLFLIYCWANIVARLRP